MLRLIERCDGVFVGFQNRQSDRNLITDSNRNRHSKELLAARVDDALPRGATKFFDDRDAQGRWNSVQDRRIASVNQHLACRHVSQVSGILLAKLPTNDYRT